MSVSTPQAPHDPKKPNPHAINNDKDLDVNLKNEQGFFGSFFQKGPANQQAQKAKRALMEAPPPSLKASANSASVNSSRPRWSSCSSRATSTWSRSRPSRWCPMHHAQPRHPVQGADAEGALAGDLQPDVLEELMKESDHVVARRKECVKMISALETASEIIATV